MVGKRLTKEHRRQQLLQVARSIIRTEGVEALTLGYLAQQAGITKPIAFAAPVVDELAWSLA